MWGHMSTTDLPGSSLLANRYRLVERLGAGGMSVVWRGFDEVLGRQVAVKVLPPSTSADPSFRRRLRAEAQAAARLSHPHITNVYDYGEATTVDGEAVPYVVMELVDGESLAAVLARVRRLPWPAAVRISAEVSAALAAAHARGIVHRDVTPANVMLTPTGAKVVDFGISALIGENDIDPDGSLLGTPAYLAPERLEGGQVSPATDVYAVGLLIYRTLIGQLPWDVGTTTALLRAHQYTEPDPLPPVEGLPSAVSALIASCLQKRPSDRPSSAELAHVLGTVSAGVPAARAFVPDWADAGEDTTILPSSHGYTDGLGRIRAGHARVAESSPGRGVAAVPAQAAPVSPAPGAVAQPVSVAEVEAAVGSNAPASAPPARAARNSRFGPVPPSTPVPQAPAAPDLPGFPAPRKEESEAPLRPSAAAAPAPAPAALPIPQPRRLGTTVKQRRIFFAAGAVLGVGLLGWAFTAVSNDPGPKGVITNAVAPAPTEGSKCVVSYAVWSDDGDRFKAAVTVANRDTKAIDNWKLWFLMPGDQVVSGNGKLRLDQQNNQVTVSSDKALNSQATTTMQFTGRYDASNAAPMVFQLDGENCDTYVSPKPGDPSRPVEHLSNGQVRLGPVPAADTPIPGISIAPNGVAVPVPVDPSNPAGAPAKPGTKPSASASTGTNGGNNGGTDGGDNGGNNGGGSNGGTDGGGSNGGTDGGGSNGGTDGGSNGGSGSGPVDPSPPASEQPSTPVGGGEQGGGTGTDTGGSVTPPADTNEDLDDGDVTTP